MSAVLVHAAPRTLWQATSCTADLFEPDTLTITRADGTVLRVFQPHEWTDVIVYGDDGYPDFAFRNDAAWRGHQESTQLRAAAGARRPA